MPSGEVTLQRIQREIYEVKMREEELRKKYAGANGADSGNDDYDEDVGVLQNGVHRRSESENVNNSSNNKVIENGSTNNNINISKNGKSNSTNSLFDVVDAAVSNRNAKSNGTSNPASFLFLKQRSASVDTKLGRMFAPNNATRGVMHRFIKSKGKLAALASVTNSAPLSNGWSSVPSIEETIAPPKVTAESGKLVRKGYVPVEERMKKEFKEMHSREHELKLERRKSQSDLLDMDDDDDDGDDRQRMVSPSKLRSARSVSHLSESNAYASEGETHSEPCSLKPARSLAQLCDADDEELEAPGSLTLIRQWESIIQKNQQHRT